MKIGVIGAGTMGQGIAKAFAQVDILRRNGYRTTIGRF